MGCGFGYIESLDKMKEIGARIRAEREKAMLSREALAAKLFVSPAVITYWEMGKHRINIDMLRSLAELFQVSEEFLMSGRRAQMEGKGQAERVLEFMQLNDGITQYDAIMELGVLRLASRISDLKHSGHKISGKMEQVTNRYGEKCYVKRYRLEKAG